MGRITQLQHQVGQLQTKLAEQGKVIKKVEARDKKIKLAISATLSNLEGSKAAPDLLRDIASLI